MAIGSKGATYRIDALWPCANDEMHQCGTWHSFVVFDYGDRRVEVVGSLLENEAVALHRGLCPHR